MIGVGGPAATDQTFFCSLIPQIRDNVDVHYYCRSYAESNLVHSGLQNHARHAMSYNIVPMYWGIFILPSLLKKMFIIPSLKELENPHYERIDIYPYTLR